MKLLLISYSYTPDLTPRAFRWSVVIDYMASQGHQVDVICVWKPGLRRKERINGVCIYRVGKISTVLVRNFFKKDGIRKNNQNHWLLSFFLQCLYQKSVFLMKLIYKHTWKQIYWPDYACLWYFPARNKAKKLVRTHQYDGLITVSFPYTAHLVGLILKKTFPSITWLVDIGDPFCFFDTIPLNNKIYQKINYSSEKQVFDFADAITVTTKPTLEKYVELFRESKAKIWVIPPLASPNEKNISEKTFFPKDDKIRLVFAGTLYKNLRNPEFVLRVFIKLLETNIADKLELHFLGNINDCMECFKEYRPLIGNKLFIHGILARHEVVRALEEAQILINIGNNSPYQLPSKVIEYAGTGKPILNFIKITNDSTMPFINTYPAALSLLEKETLTNGQFEKLFDFIKQAPDGIEDAILGHLLSPYRIESIGKVYENFLLNPSNKL